MNKRCQAVLVIAALLAAQVACNLPTANPNVEGTQIPFPNQTFTALAQALTPVGETTPTATLPPVVTATRPDGNQPSPTLTTAPGNNPTATRAPGTNPTPTTAAQQPTPTIPNLRPRAQVVARFLNTPPTIDGDWSEWKDITQEYPATSTVFGRNNWTNADDLSGSFHVGWDNNNFYIAVKVRDDRYVQNATGENIFKGDSIEILLDTRLQEDFYYNNLSPDDFQLGISPGRPDPAGPKEAYLWLPGNVAGPRTGIQIAARQETGVYRMEAAIPWHIFETTPTEGTHMGFVFSVSDNDDAGSDTQQTMASNNPDRSLTDPTTWGDIHFVK